MEGLRVSLGSLGQARQGCALRLRHQAEFQARELLELADVGKHGAVVGALIVDEGNRRAASRAFVMVVPPSSDTQLPSMPADFMPTLTEAG